MEIDHILVAQVAGHIRLMRRLEYWIGKHPDEAVPSSLKRALEATVLNSDLHKEIEEVITGVRKHDRRVMKLQLPADTPPDVRKLFEDMFYEDYEWWCEGECCGCRTHLDPARYQDENQKRVIHFQGPYK